MANTVRIDGKTYTKEDLLDELGLTSIEEVIQEAQSLSLLCQHCGKVPKSVGHGLIRCPDCGATAGMNALHGLHHWIGVPNMENEQHCIIDEMCVLVEGPGVMSIGLRLPTWQEKLSWSA